MAETPDKGAVLVVEDDDSIRLLLREMLRTGGFRTVDAADGDSALATAIEHGPDAILLDIGLPGLHGLAVLERLKAEPLVAGVPVIVVTAWGGRESVERALRAGAVGYVRKPFDTRQLLAHVDKAVRSGSAARLT